MLWIAAYGSPDAAPASLLAETTLGTASAPIDLHALPPAARLGDLHVTTAYVRAVFFDDAVADDAPIAAGSWIAGYDLDDGLVEAKLAPVALSPGEIVTLPLSLVALRDLVVTVRTAPGLFPLGDGRGAVRVLASAAASLETTATMRFFGEGELACADPEASAGARVRGYVAGPGPAWIFAALDDFGAGGLGPAGGLVSVDHTTPTAIVLPDANRASYAQDAYRVEATVWLTTAVPRSSAAPDALTCF